MNYALTYLVLLFIASAITGFSAVDPPSESLDMAVEQSAKRPVVYQTWVYDARNARRRCETDEVKSASSDS